MSVKVAVAQFGATVDKVENRTHVQRLIAEASDEGASLVVLPENAMYANPDVTADTSAEWEPLDGLFVSAVQESARQHDIGVVVGMTEVLEGSAKASNTVVVVRADGAVEGVYRKVHLYDAFGYKESDRVQAAPYEPLVFKLGGLAFGVMTCYDMRFPEMARALVDAGANALIVPAAWAVGPAKEDHWVTLARARAIENTVYALVSGQSGPLCTGQSMVIDPMGVVVASAGEAPGVAGTTISADRLEAVRAKNPSLANRRFRIVTSEA
jgi:predicted amidohydrolase